MRTVLFTLLLSSTVCFAQINQACHTDSDDRRAFAAGYVGAIVDVLSDMTVEGKKVYEMPRVNYEQAFDAVCRVIDEHPELWTRPSREAVTFAVNVLWRREQ